MAGVFALIFGLVNIERRVQPSVNLRMKLDFFADHIGQRRGYSDDREPVCRRLVASQFREGYRQFLAAVAAMANKADTDPAIFPGNYVGQSKCPAVLERPAGAAHHFNLRTAKLAQHLRIGLHTDGDVARIQSPIMNDAVDRVGASISHASEVHIDLGFVVVPHDQGIAHARRTARKIGAERSCRRRDFHRQADVRRVPGRNIPLHP